jgi:glutamate-1-semialdehyde 2,1-aminomutase
VVIHPTAVDDAAQDPTGGAVGLVGDSPIDAAIAEQEQEFLERQPRSRHFIERARKSLAGGVTSSWQITRPQAVWLSHGAGSKIYDVDGTEYVDLHGGYGAGLAGHAHPAIVEAVRAQVARGTHFAQPTEDSIIVAEELGRRFGLPLWRFLNSGTEATMDAVHLMRSITGRDILIKAEGGYHGHHDSVEVSVTPDAEDVGPAERPVGVASSTGVPLAIRALTIPVAFNSVDHVRRVLEEHPGQVAGMIVEPIIMNAGIIMPDEGYLQGLKDVLHAHGALLAFDEVKTGLTVGHGGATKLFGVSPDIICLAKAIGGGLICAAIGGTAEVMGHVADGNYDIVGTFNGNPLSMAATRAMLLEVVTDDAYDRIGLLREKLAKEVTSELAGSGLAGHVVSVGAKGCVTFSAQPVRDYRDFLEVDDRYNHAHWVFQHNGGVFLPPWGKTEQWLISVQHDESDIDRFLNNFARFVRAVKPR